MYALWVVAGHLQVRNVAEWIGGYDGDSVLLFEGFPVFLDLFRGADIAFGRLKAHLGRNTEGIFFESGLTRKRDTVE